MNPCQNGHCTEQQTTYLCTCKNGYEGRNCSQNINECQNNPCRNGGSCIDGLASYSCKCAPGYTGVLCETSKHIILGF